MKAAGGYASRRELRYGVGDSRTGDLYLPHEAPKGLVCLLHGGFWQLPYGKEELSALSEALASSGYAVWNIEYRRVGEPGGGFPGSLDDCVDAINGLERLAADLGPPRPLPRVVAGHSAGGYLALMLNARLDRLSVLPEALIGLAPIVDLRACGEDPGRRGQVAAFLESGAGTGAEAREPASPDALPGYRIGQRIFHGDSDPVLPIEEVRGYAAKVAARGGAVEFTAVEEAGHMDFVDPGSEAARLFRQYLDRLFAAPSRAPDARPRTPRP